MDKNGKNSEKEIESTMLLGGEVKKGDSIWWKNLAFFCYECSGMIENLRQFMTEYGDGPFNVSHIMKWSEFKSIVYFFDKNGCEVGVPQDYLCSAKIYELSDREKLNLLIGR